MATPVRVAVLGAAGRIGRVIVCDLAESTEIAELLLLDRDPAVEDIAARVTGCPARAVVLDARQGLAGRIEGCQVLVHAAGYRLNLEAMAAALAAPCHYLDLGGLYWMTRRQLEFDERFIGAERVALLGLGASPGTTNVMVDRAVRELGEKALAISVAVAARDPAPAGDGSCPPGALPRLVDQLRMAPVVLEAGVARAVAPLAGGGWVEFPEPIGRAETVYALSSELQTLGQSFDVPRVSFRVSLPPPLVDRLRGLLGASVDELAAAAAASLPPSEQSIAGHVVEVRSAQRMARISALTPPHEEWGIGGGALAAAAPAAAAVRLIARGKIEPVGVVPPETSVDPDDLLPELEQRGIRFTVEVGDWSRAG